ncbi:MAG: hypothetical protein RIF46_07950 [Cyclobacteriaceae bacterium]
MTNEQIEQVLVQHVRDEYLVDNDRGLLTKDLNLVSTGVLDSVSTLALVDFVEKRFEIEFLPHEIDEDNIGTIEILASFIQEKKKS